MKEHKSEVKEERNDGKKLKPGEELRGQDDRETAAEEELAASKLAAVASTSDAAFLLGFMVLNYNNLQTER